jgi:hypothetical protein
MHGADSPFEPKGNLFPTLATSRRLKNDSSMQCTSGKWTANEVPSLAPEPEGDKSSASASKSLEQLDWTFGTIPAA